ncbi:MAG: hypothetical protein HCA25_13315 [Dolichospermum sp. DET50]|nr:hypothetical protein [Dolichospermum sp. DET66]MBS3033220.1 hypothetical protein [Dolichospermum sp. DET67]MBS3038424.1 hypothetical protein [Dolichospermum sp. DET50]QSX70310.1 MAG: hypothetical protein EZY12_12530 [Dolichospermum sp. DET69]
MPSNTAPNQALIQGPSSSATSYIVPIASGVNLTSIFTVGDSVNNKPDGTPYKMVGIPDGLGAFDNGNGTFTLLMNQEIGSTSGITRAHGGKGAFVSSWIINKSDLSVVSGDDLIKNVYNWDASNQQSNTTTSTINFNRFCSADLATPTAYYNAATGLGSQERIFMSGEEGGSNGYQLAIVATGANKGNTYVLGKFNLSTNGSGLTGVGGWENALANPYVQDKTIVIGNNDGGTGIMSQSLAVYVGTKTNTGTEIDKAGLTNGILKFVNVTGSPTEIVNTTTRATNITSGTAFTLSGTASTAFSRPEDGAWNPLNPSQYFFVTTDRRDDVNDGIGTQIGRTRLWRLNFNDITNPDAGGTIDMLLDGTEGGNMFDNMTVDKYGHILLQEDVGGAAHNGKIWQYDIATDSLKLLAKHDPARFGDIGVAATAPFSNDEESSGIIDAQDILGPGWFLLNTQAHYGITGELVEGGQLQALFNPDTYNAYQNSFATFNFDNANYATVEGNTSGFNTNATVRVTRTGNTTGTDTVTLQLTDGTAKGSATAPTQDTIKGLSSSATPYIIPTTPGSGVNLTSIFTVGDSVNNKSDGTPYKMVGIPDGLGAFDNGNGTFTLLMNQEIGSTSGITRAHGGKGAFVSSWIINKSDLSVVSGDDLIKNVYNWDASNQQSNTTTSIINFNRFCSADLANPTAYYNAATGLGSQERIFMSGEEGGSNGYQLAIVATGANKGNTYVLGKFNLSTNGSGLTGVGGWENALANPYVQDKTIVIGNNDGGTGIMSQSLAVYVGTKTNTGTEIDKAGLTNGILKFVNVTGSPAEIVNTTTRATNITSGTAFTLSGTASTAFSRPEDGAWNPLNPSQYFFVTTDRRDDVNDGIGSQIGRTRLWRLNFSDITNPDAGGTIDMLLDGTEGGNMFDNMTVDKYGHILLQEDVGGAAHNGKIWQYDIATDSLKLLAKHDPARFGDIGVAATAPFSNDEESSGIIDAQDILGPGWFLLNTQAHYGISGELVEGGQLQALFNPDTYKSYQADYINSPITVTFAPGETYKDVQISVAGDTNVESNETVNLTLTNPSTGSLVGTNQPNAVLTIVNDELPPTEISLSSFSVNENVNTGTVIGNFNTTDPNVDDSFTYTLVDDTNYADNTAFQIVGNQLQSNASLNYEAKNNYNIKVRSTDSSGLYTDKTFTVTLNDVNEAPVLIAPATQTANSNISQIISGISLTDVDAGNSSLQVTLALNDGSATLGSTSGLNFAVGDGNQDTYMNFSGSLSAINTALNNLSYRSNFGFFGNDTINLSVNDQGNTGSGGALTDSKAIALTVYNLINGTSGNNSLIATTNPDRIFGKAGNDTITSTVANAGQNDLFDGGDGTDTLVISGGIASTALTLNVANTSNQLSGISGLVVQNFESFNFANFLGNLNATGSTGNDTITGGAGNDTLDGGAGTNILAGGAGNDTYIISTLTNTITEAANAGIDTVQSSVTYTLATNVENLVLTGINNLNGTGNTLNNTLTGNSGNNILNGGTGADTLIGDDGNDTYIVDNTSDTVVELDNKGTDTVNSSVTYTLSDNVENLTLTGGGSVNGTGNSLNNIITANIGSNILDGGVGNDTLIGGAGNDTYIVDSVDDVVTEAANAGIDTVQSSVTYTLATNVENLVLTGINNLNGTGNTLNNTLTGNSGNNILNGGTGADNLIGGAGDDTYIVDNASDNVFELLNEGTDTVNSSVTYTLSDNVENLTLTGIGSINGTGNSLNNIITGNAGINILNGGSGADTFTGGLGNDTLYLGLHDGAVDIVNYASGNGADTIYQFERTVLGDQLKFTGITNIDVITSGTSTQLRVSDGITGNTGFGTTGSLLVTLSGTSGFTSADVNQNLFGANFFFS